MSPSPPPPPPKIPKGVIRTTMACPRCGETLLYRPPAGRTVWCPRRTRDLNNTMQRCGYTGAAPGYFAAKNDPRQGQLL